MARPTNFEEYLADCPKESQEGLTLLRKTIKAAALDAMEVISYSMPAYKQNVMLAWFAAHTHHIGFYPGASGIAVFKKALAGFKMQKALSSSHWISPSLSNWYRRS